MVIIVFPEVMIMADIPERSLDNCNAKIAGWVLSVGVIVGIEEVGFSNHS